MTNISEEHHCEAEPSGQCGHRIQWKSNPQGWNPAHHGENADHTPEPSPALGVDLELFETTQEINYNGN